MFIVHIYHIFREILKVYYEKIYNVQFYLNRIFYHQIFMFLQHIFQQFHSIRITY